MKVLNITPFFDLPMNTKNSNCITILIFLTALTTVVAAALQPLFASIFQVAGLQELLGLSRWGLSHYFLWQPFTTMLVQNEVGGIGLFFLLNLSFSLYLLYIFGTDLVEEYGASAFLKLYFISGAISFLTALFFTPGIWQNLILAGMTPSLLATFTVWAILHKEAQLFFYAIIPMKTKTLLAIVAALSLLMPISELNIPSFIYCAMGLFCGYFASTFIWRAKTPYTFMQPIDEHFIETGDRFRALISSFRKVKPSSKDNKNTKDKVVGIHTGKPILDDEAFMDEMLAKISRYGESSLTRQEKDRMRQISEKKSKDN